MFEDPIIRITLREACEISSEILKEAEAARSEQAASIAALEAECAVLRSALERNKQGYRNILESRKLAADVWGTRDGYGGRYGALTREEIEGVITEINQALTSTTAGADLAKKAALADRLAQHIRKYDGEDVDSDCQCDRCVEMRALIAEYDSLNAPNEAAKEGR